MIERPFILRTRKEEEKKIDVRELIIAVKLYDYIFEKKKEKFKI